MSEEDSNENRVWRWFNATADRIIAVRGKQHDEPEHRRLRIITSMLLLLSPLLVASALRAFLVEDTGSLSSALEMVGMLVPLFLLISLGVSSSIITQLLGGSFFIILLLNSIAYEGALGAGQAGLALIPVLLMLSLGRRVGVVWCGISVTGIAIVGLMDDQDPLLVNQNTAGNIFYALIMSGAAYAFDRSRELALARAHEARQAAEESAEAKSRFLANMSHEIRTPMNGVLGMLGLLLDGSLDSKDRAHAELAHTSAVNLLDLLNDILDFSKIEAGQLALESVPFDLRTTIDNVLDQAALSAGAEGLELGARFGPGVPSEVVGDPGRVRQVLLNLVNNAVKFTERGHVLVSATRAEQSSDLVRLEVQDTGIGISAARQATVFDYFQQADTSTTRLHGGTGLGLAIVRELAERMGGRVGLHSELGRGYTVWMELPLPSTERSDARPSAPAALVGRRVLVVDDHQINRQILDEQLRASGLHPDGCESGSEALERLREARAEGRSFDMAILDSHMPQMSGVELAQQIKADPAIAGTVLVMLRSISDQATVLARGEAGFAAYLVKPVHHNALVDTLARAWSERENEPPGRPSPQSNDGLARRGSTFEHTEVLVVEDNPVNQRVIQLMLERLECKVDVAADGQVALNMLQSTVYDVVFMDVQMPVMDGLQATAALRERERGGGRHVPVVAITAHAMESDRERCLASGMDDYISKPVRQRDLLQVLATLRLERGNSHSSP